MQHVDEALLVAYADDAVSPAERADVEAHLVGCAECRARVEEERALAARAAAVLGSGVPAREPEMPAFADIVRRSEQPGGTSSGGAGRSRQRSWTMPPLAWAAMLVVGLGAAVIARTLLVSPDFNAPVPTAGESSEGAAARSVAAPEGGAAADEVAAEAEAAADEASTSVRTEAAPQSAAGVEDARPAQVVTAVPPAAAQSQQRAAEVVPDAAKAAAPPAPAPAPAPSPDDLRARPADAPPFEPSRERQRYADMVRRDSAEREAAAQAERAIAAESIAFDALVVTGAGAGGPGAIALRTQDVAWRGASVADAPARNAPPTGVPDAAVTSVWLATDSAAWRARVVQQVDSVSVEIIEWRVAPGTAGQRGTLADGRNSLFVVHDGVTFLLRAALPADRLAALGRMLRPLS